MCDPDQKTDAVVLNNEHRNRAELQEAPASGDLELIRWALSLSLEERLAALQDFVDTFWTPQHG
ncbi:MAG: hypothetical protein ACC742_17350 [Thermoanaerobaculales bacterium]